MTSRRWFVRECPIGMGALALNHLMGATLEDPMAPKKPHFAPKAKRVVFLFMAGAPSHLEMFDYKPQLEKFDGTLPPADLLKGYRAAFINPNSRLMGPRFKFSKHGQSGAELSELYQLGATMPRIVDSYTALGASFISYKEAGMPRNLMNGNPTNFGPRIGFAYRLSERKSPMVLRGGYRMSYFPVPLDTWGRRMRQNIPLTAPFLNNLLVAENAPDGIGNYGLRSVPSIIAGRNSGVPLGGMLY